MCRSQWPRGLRRRSVAAHLLRLWVRIPPEAWMFVCCECCVLSGRGLCDELVTRPEESYGLLCVVVCDLETSRMRRPWPTGGLSRQKQNKTKNNIVNLQFLPDIMQNFPFLLNNKNSFSVTLNAFSFSQISDLIGKNCKLLKLPTFAYLTSRYISLLL